MRIEGRHTFTAVGSKDGGPIEWRLERRGSPTPLVVQEARGESVMLDLPFTGDGKYTIHAQDAGFKDAQEVKVFPVDVRTSFIFESTGNPEVPVHIKVPATVSPSSRILMVHHGSSRNANDYCDNWSTWLQRADYVVVCPEFGRGEWPRSAGYNLGNVFTGSDGEGMLNPEGRWAFTITNEIYLEVKEGFRITAETYDVWGHSAGGQFVHRTLLFNPNAPIRFAIAANPGWYTTPDLQVAFPYGLSHSLLAFGPAQVQAFTGRRLIIMRGTRDTERSESLRQTPEADAQGRNRYERAGYMYRRGVALNRNHRWQLIDVPGVGHSHIGMAPPAMDFLEANLNAR